MSTANDAYKRAANSPAAREAVKTAKSIGEDVSETVSDFASDVSRQASEQFGRARDAAVDAYEQVHEASVRNPHLSSRHRAGYRLSVRNCRRKQALARAAFDGQTLAMVHLAWARNRACAGVGAALGGGRGRAGGGELGSGWRSRGSGLLPCAGRRQSGPEGSAHARGRSAAQVRQEAGAKSARA